MEQLDYNLLSRWFVGLGIDDPVWDVTVFTKNRDRLLGGEIASKFFAAVLDDARVKGLLSDEHFSVDGTLIQAWASLKSFRPKDGSGEPPAPGATASAISGARSAPTLQRDTPFDHRRRCAAVPQGRRSAKPALLHRPRAGWRTATGSPSMPS
jgi:hypothetical protein